jgi:hypothetical protein
MRRNADGDAEWIVEHVYVRGVNGSLKQLAKLPGIDCIRKEQVSQIWIDELLQQEKSAESRTISINSFVRVLTGPCARLCGHVTKLDTVIVCIRMKTKKVSLFTILPNLQLIECPAEQQVFYYQPALFS